MRHLFVLTSLGLTGLLGGCASVTDGYQQLVAVETFGEEGRVLGAQCQLSNPKGTASLHTPGIALVRRSFDDLTIRCEKPGFGPGEAKVASVTKPMAILGGLSGIAVDTGTGAAFEYPPLIKVTLGAPVARSPLVPGESLAVAPPPPMVNPLADAANAPAKPAAIQPTQAAQR